MEEKKRNQIRKTGRKPKIDPAVHRYSINLNAEDNAKFLALFDQSEMKVIAHFITACIFQKTVKTVKIDMDAIEYHEKLTRFFSQFRSIGTNYNQIVKILYRNFSEKKAGTYLFRLEKETIELVQVTKEVIRLTQEFEEKYLKKSKVMIAKIGKGSNMYGAILYNQQKVDKENGAVLLLNKIPDTVDSKYSVAYFNKCFEPYLSANIKTEKTVRHISLNPDPADKVSDEQFTEMAQEYMERMGYGNQPYIVFKHTDIDRTHIHIVSTCVGIDGKKIPDAYDHPRSMAICRDLETKYNLQKATEQEQKQTDKIFKKVEQQKGDIKSQIASVVRHLPKYYQYTSLGTYNALLSFFNITAEEIKGERNGEPVHGLVYFALNDKGEKVSNPFKASLFGKDAGVAQLQKHFEHSKEKMKTNPARSVLKNTVELAIHTTNNESEFKKQLTEEGINTVVRRNSEGLIYGMTFIDHESRSVWNGSQLDRNLSANVFNDWWNNGNKPELKIQDSPVSNTNTIDHQPTKDLFEFISQEHSANSDLGLFNLLPDAQGEDYEEEQFAKQMKRKEE